jgi:hypothetical protein
MEKVNTVIINQYFGCGDIIYSQFIANKFINEGYNVLWPVMDIYAPLAKHFPNITMVDKSLVNIDYSRRDAYVINGCRVIPLRFADSLCCVPYTDCMKAKAILLDMDWQKWKEGVHIERDFANEKKLYYEVLKLQPNEKYNLISDQFCTGGTRTGSIENTDNGLRNVHMKFIEGYTMIDWLMTMQGATNIYAVASSNIYLWELFPMKAQINIFIRRPIEQNHDNYKYILIKDNYILHP